MRNVGSMDRMVRIVAGVGMLVLGFGGYVTGVPGLVLKIAGFVPLLTAAVGICPLYLPLGLSTRGKA